MTLNLFRVLFLSLSIVICGKFLPDLVAVLTGEVLVELLRVCMCWRDGFAWCGSCCFGFNL